MDAKEFSGGDWSKRVQAKDNSQRLESSVMMTHRQNKPAFMSRLTCLLSAVGSANLTIIEKERS